MATRQDIFKPYPLISQGPAARQNQASGGEGAGLHPLNRRIDRSWRDITPSAEKLT